MAQGDYVITVRLPEDWPDKQVEDLFDGISVLVYKTREQHNLGDPVVSGRKQLGSDPSPNVKILSTPEEVEEALQRSAGVEQ